MILLVAIIYTTVLIECFPVGGLSQYRHWFAWCIVGGVEVSQNARASMKISGSHADCSVLAEPATSSLLLYSDILKAKTISTEKHRDRRKVDLARESCISWREKSFSERVRISPQPVELAFPHHSTGRRYVPFLRRVFGMGSFS